MNNTHHLYSGTKITQIIPRQKKSPVVFLPTYSRTKCFLPSSLAFFAVDAILSLSGAGRSCQPLNVLLRWTFMTETRDKHPAGLFTVPREHTIFYFAMAKRSLWTWNWDHRFFRFSVWFTTLTVFCGQKPCELKPPGFDAPLSVLFPWQLHHRFGHV